VTDCFAIPELLGIRICVCIGVGFGHVDEPHRNQLLCKPVNIFSIAFFPNTDRNNPNRYVHDNVAMCCLSCICRVNGAISSIGDPIQSLKWTHKRLVCISWVHAIVGQCVNLSYESDSYFFWKLF